MRTNVTNQPKSWKIGSEKKKTDQEKLNREKKQKLQDEKREKEKQERKTFVRNVIESARKRKLERNTENYDTAKTVEVMDEVKNKKQEKIITLNNFKTVVPLIGG